MHEAPMTMKALAAWLRERSEPAGQCWIWTGAVQKSRGGAPVARVNGRVRMVRGVIAECLFGPAPEGGKRWWSITTCTDPMCVRPAHVQRISASEAIPLYLSNGRPIGWSAHRKVHITGGKLTLEQVEQIRSEAERGAPRSDLSQRFGVSMTSIGRIIRRDTWNAGAARYIPGSSAFNFRP